MGSECARIVLAADIGGSRARLLLARATEDGWHVLRRRETPSAAHADVEALIGAFLAEAEEQPVAACIAVAGAFEKGSSAIPAIQNGRVHMTNLPWIVDGERLGAHFGLSRVQLTNDFAAQAHGLACLDDEGLCTLHAGEPDAAGVRALIGAGTGLGMAVLAGAPQWPVALASQGGLADFAPRDARELALCETLLARHGRVSLEMLLSGHGIERLYRFVSGLPPEAPLDRDAAAIAAAALVGEAAAIETLRFFARLFAAAAGNLALTVLAYGGVYLTGGIAPRILPFLREPGVVEAFRAHPSMGAVLARMPLHVVRDELLGLKGAARIAASMVRDAV
ncbi:MAG: glucokinase [Azoarcus sp.]|jgi:glucokinase|nr:glucokinase [Azoarcus sp.]